MSPTTLYADSLLAAQIAEVNGYTGLAAALFQIAQTIGAELLNPEANSSVWSPEGFGPDVPALTD